MTPKQKLKKLKAKEQFKKLGKNNAHRDQYGRTQASKEEASNRRKQYVGNYDPSLIYLDAVALQLLGRATSKKLKL